MYIYAYMTYIIHIYIIHTCSYKYNIYIHTFIYMHNTQNTFNQSSITPGSLFPCNGDDVYLKKDYNEGVTKSNPTQKCRPAKGMSKKVNI
jgi:hypothetical protein